MLWQVMLIHYNAHVLAHIRYIWKQLMMWLRRRRYDEERTQSNVEKNACFRFSSHLDQKTF